MHSNQWKKIPSPCVPYREILAKMFREDISYQKMAEEIQIDVKSVKQFLDAEGLRRPMNYRPSACNKHRDLVLKMAGENASLNDIARTVGTTGVRVREFLDAAGVKRDYVKNYGGARSPSWKGGKISARGYVKLWMPDNPNANSHGYVWEHRHVMEESIGRLLLRNEVVHHRNGKKKDNRIENLQLFSENSEHLKHELTGRVPKWTPDGLARMKKAIDRRVNRRRGTNEQHPKVRDRKSQETYYRSKDGLQSVQPPPSQMEHPPASDHAES